MSKNLIYMVAIDHNTSEYKNSDYSQYSIKSWKYWCEVNDVDFMLITEHDDRLGKPIWNKELIFEKAEVVFCCSLWLNPLRVFWKLSKEAEALFNRPEEIMSGNESPSFLFLNLL